MCIKRIKKIAKILIPLVILATIMGCAPSATQPKGWSGAVINGNILFAGSMNGRLVSVDVSTGISPWAAALPLPQASGGGFGCGAPAAAVAIYSTPAVSGDLVYIGGYVQSGNKSTGKVYAYVIGQNEPRWVYPRDGYLSGPIVGGLVAYRGNVYFGAADGKVYALDAVDGHKIAEFQTEEKIWSTPLVDGDILYIGSFDKKLYVLDVATLKPVKWKAFKTEGAIVATPLVDKGTVYVGSYDRYLYAVDAATGNLKWKFLSEKPFWAQPVAYNDVIYAPSLDNKVYILNAATGVEVAPSIDLASPISSSPVVIEGKIIFASQEGKIYTLDIASNKINLLTDLKEVIYAALTVSNGMIYVHTDRDSLYAVDASTAATKQLFFR